MARKCPDSDLENAIRRYVEGEGIQLICASIPCLGHARLTRILHERGLLRDKAARYRISGMKTSATVKALSDIDDAAIVADYVAGMSEAAVAVKHGVARPTVRNRLLAAGIARRNRSEAMYLRMSQLGPEERSRISAKAHDAVRGKTRSHEELVRRAQSRERAGRFASQGERVLWEMLNERGILATPQMAVGPYNADLGTDAVAVEVYGGSWHAFGGHQATASQRLRHFFDAGFNVIVVTTAARCPVTGRAADEVVAFIERSRRDPTFRRQYRVIRGSGKPSSSYRIDLDEVA